MTTIEAIVWQAALEALQPPKPAQRPTYPTPGALAAALDPRTVQTPALDLIDQALVDVAEGRCKRLMLAMPPQEGKANGSAAAFRCGC
jgi:hypothetical protein